MKLKIFILFLSIFVLSTKALAQGGGSFYSNISDASIGDEFVLEGLKAGQTYICEMNTRDFATGLSSTVTSPSGTISAIYIGEDYPAVHINTDMTELNPLNNEVLDQSAADNRIVFVAPESGTYKMVISVWGTDSLTVSSSTHCTDNTQNVGFNTFVNDLNFLEITNTLDRTLSVSWEAVKFDGTSLSGTVDIPANTRKDVDIHTPVGASSYGNVKIGVLGGHGAAILNLSQYQTTNTGIEQRTSRSAEGAGGFLGFF